MTDTDKQNSTGKYIN